MRRFTWMAVLAIQLAMSVHAVAADYFIVGGGRMQASCGTLLFTLESSSSSGISITRLNAGSGITGRVPMPLFQLEMRDASGERYTLTSDEGWQKASMKKTDRQSCLLKFSRPMPSTDRELSVSVKIQISYGENDEPGLAFTWADCKFPAGWTLERTILLPLHFGPPSERTYYFYPY